MRTNKKRVGRHWTRQASDPDQEKRLSKWWANPKVVSHINKRVCGAPIAGLSAGFNRALAQRISGRTIRRAVSIGCGNASKEIRLLEQDLVAHFEVYELSRFRFKQGKAIAKKKGLSDRITFYNKDPFSESLAERFDLVHWNNSLHHMMDVPQAIRWSYDSLVRGGLFAMDDYVGPDRFQWSTSALEFAQTVRNKLPAEFFEGRAGMAKISRELKRQNPVKMSEVDPSEAADSSRTIDAIEATLLNPEITPTGGAVWHIALSKLLARFDMENPSHTSLLDTLLLLDEMTISEYGTNYAVAFAVRD